MTIDLEGSWLGDENSRIIIGLIFIAIFFLIFLGGLIQTMQGPHWIYASAHRDGVGMIVVQYHGGRDQTFVESISIYVDGEKVREIQDPRVNDRYYIAAPPRVVLVEIYGRELGTEIDRRIGYQTL